MNAFKCVRVRNAHNEKLLSVVKDYEFLHLLWTCCFLYLLISYNFRHLPVLSSHALKYKGTKQIDIFFLLQRSASASAFNHDTIYLNKKHFYFAVLSGECVFYYYYFSTSRFALVLIYHGCLIKGLLLLWVSH